MSVFLLDSAVRDQLIEAVAWARANPIPWSLLQKHLPKKQRDNELRLEDLSDDWRPPSRQIDMPFGWRIAIGCEQQPAGLLLHISMSTPTPTKTLPRPDAIKLISEEFVKMGVIKPEATVQTWIEEFLVDGQPGGKAINVVWLLEKSK